MDQQQATISSLHSRAAKIAHQIHQVDDLVKKAYEKGHDAEMYMRKKFNGVWESCHFSSLPKWLQDNDYLHSMHRPPLESFRECFWSIFRVHTETINIWTHMIGCILFCGLANYFMFYSSLTLSWLDRVIFSTFFIGAILCFAMSTFYHTFSCHSPRIVRLFVKLDYCGITLLITGSFIPWLYYGFYCDYYVKLCYTLIVFTLCTGTIFVSFSEKFSDPSLKPFRASVFMAFGLSGLIPGIHWLYLNNWFASISLRTALLCLLLMAILYIIGTLLYASRIPERFFPGKCDVWFHSHQLFHIFVTLAAIVHYRGLIELAFYRIKSRNVCEVELK